ncbi:hypothetical protein LINPERPRIM_LOCUS19009 [Linum perenne]
MRDELRGIIEGICLGWDKGVRKLCVQMDSKVAISIMKDVANREYCHASLVEQFLLLKSRD